MPMSAEQLIRAAFICGSIDKDKAEELRSFSVEYDLIHPATAETRTDMEAKRKLVEAESVRYTQERDLEMITRAQRALAWFREEVEAFLAQALDSAQNRRRVTVASIREFAREHDLKLEDD